MNWALHMFLQVLKPAYSWELAWSCIHYLNIIWEYLFLLLLKASAAAAAATGMI